MYNVAVLGDLESVPHIDALRLEAVEQKSSGKQRHDDATGPDLEQELAAFPVHEGDGHQRHHAVEHFNGDIALCRVVCAHASLFKDDDEEAKDGVDARGLVTGQYDTCENKGNHVFALQQGTSCALFSALLVLGGKRLHLLQLTLCLRLRGGAPKCCQCLFFSATTEEPSRCLAQEKRAKHEDQAGVDDRQKHSAPCMILGCPDQHRIASSCGDGGFRESGVVPAGERGDDDAEGQHELEDDRSLAAMLCIEALRKIERHDDSNHA